MDIPIRVKLDPALGSISTFRNLGLTFQLMSEKLPVLVKMLPSPITKENIPWALVVASLDSWYSVEPVSELISTEKRSVIFWLTSTSPEAVRANPWKLMPPVCAKVYWQRKSESARK
uniref:hypothetical protein n=1 Tax=Algoriphagus sp. TaxID=1872435 RepID=UPI0040473A52